MIDYVGFPSVTSPDLDVPSDLDNFRDHFLHAVLVVSELYPGYSATNLLGDRLYRVLQGLRNSSYGSFRELLEDYARQRRLVPAGHFKAPVDSPFGWLRVEWIPSPDKLVKLFQPEDIRFGTIAQFGNTLVSGPKGSGKSHYLRVLAFHPALYSQHDEALDAKLAQLGIDFRRSFGVLFACRLGEFKSFDPEAMGQADFDPGTQAFLKHIFVLKIITKTLSHILQGLQTQHVVECRSVLDPPAELTSLVAFLSERLGGIEYLDDSRGVASVSQLLAMCVARENSAVAVWNDPARRPAYALLAEGDLDRFFEVVKATFPDLHDAVFFVLVDDASRGNISFSAQKVLNSLVRGAQANHCFKITFDRFMYTTDTAEGRGLDPAAELAYVDLGEVSTKSQRGMPVNLADYMSRVIDYRLRQSGFTRSIVELLGPSQDVREFLSRLTAPRSRRPKPGVRAERTERAPHAYYAGWNIFWQLSHGSVRTLLEMVEYVLRSCNVTRDTSGVPLGDQDRAVRDYSRRRFKALVMVAGEHDGEPMGQRLRAVVSALGAVSREYLRHYNTGDSDRWYETISIERLDSGELNSGAGAILRQLVDYGLLLAEGVTFTRAQFGLAERYDLNKVFAPAFETTYRVRNHMFLSRRRLETLLLRPDTFVRERREKLRLLADRVPGPPRQGSLFDDDAI